MNRPDEIVLVIPEEPGQRPPAPEPLRLIQQFVNTFDREAGRDQLASSEVLARWFSVWTRWPGLALPSGEEHARALAVREGIRDLAQHSLAAEAPFEKAVQELDIRLVVQVGQLRLDSTTRLGRALSPILDAVRAAMDDGSWARMKVCDRERCRWLYYDSSRNASSRWCATDICGAREKAQRAYRRKRSVK